MLRTIFSENLLWVSPELSQKYLLRNLTCNTLAIPPNFSSQIISRILWKIRPGITSEILSDMYSEIPQGITFDNQLEISSNIPPEDFQKIFRKVF